MTRDPITDPEVLADLRRRSDSEHDRSRATGPERPFGDPAIVEQWPCDGCSAMVGITAAVLAAHETCNRKLAARREQPLVKRGRCDACRARYEATLQKQRDARRPHEQTEMPALGASAAARELAERTNRRRNTR